MSRNEHGLFNKIFEVTVDYSKSVKDMVTIGNYWRVEHQITDQNFPIVGSGKAKFNTEIVRFDKRLSSEEILSRFKARNLSPAKIEILLAFAASYPEEERDYIIVALGSVWKRKDNVLAIAYLSSGKSGWWLRPYYFENVWFEQDCFLAVHEPAKALN